MEEAGERSGITEVPCGVAAVAFQSVPASVSEQIGAMYLCTDLIAHEIPFLNDAPVRQLYRPSPPSDYDMVKEHINKLLEAQVIQENLKKTVGSLRMCIDYRPLNSKTRKDAFPLPHVEICRPHCCSLVLYRGPCQWVQ